MRKIVSVAILPALFLSGCASAPTRSITAGEFLGHIKYLASDRLGGRGNGSAGLEQAARYIAGQFSAAWLEPLPDGSYRQSFEIVTGSRIEQGNRLQFAAADRRTELTIESDWLPVSRGAGVSDAELVFAGYGISAPELGYDDYSDLDVTGKAVLILDGEPQRDDADSPFSGRLDTEHASVQSKVLNALGHGAAALLIVSGPLQGAAAEAQLERIQEGWHIEKMGIAAARILPAALMAALGDSGPDLADIQQRIDAELQPRSGPLGGMRLTLNLRISDVKSTVVNVVGVLPGSDPALRDEVIVVGAHYDHLGLGYGRSAAPQLVGRVHNGADDNASGVSGLIEIAERLSFDLGGTRRTIYFVAFAGEEIGVLGSTHFVDNPPCSLDDIVAMINMDMIGRPQGRRLIVGGVDTAEQFRQLLGSVNSDYGFDLALDSSGIGGSDHTPFATRSIPVLFFFSGVHDDYHKPSDDWEKIEPEGGARIAGFVADVIERIDAMDSRPRFVQVDAPSTPVQQPEASPGARPWFGSVPDFSYDGEGYRFQAVRPGSPAAEAGLQAQDVMIEFAGRKVTGLYDYTAALRTCRPGDEVEVVVLRSGREVRVTVTLRSRSEVR